MSNYILAKVHKLIDSTEINEWFYYEEDNNYNNGYFEYDKTIKIWDTGEVTVNGGGYIDINKSMYKNLLGRKQELDKINKETEINDYLDKKLKETDKSK